MSYSRINLVAKSTMEVIKRPMMSHADLVKEHFIVRTPMIDKPSFLRILTEKYGYYENVSYHLKKLLETELIEEKDEGYYLTTKGVILAQTLDSLRPLMKHNRFYNTDLQTVLDLYWQIESKPLERSPGMVAKRLDMRPREVYKAITRLKKSHAIKEECTLSLDQRRTTYTLDSLGLHAVEGTICGFLAQQIVETYPTPVFVDIAQLHREYGMHSDPLSRLITMSYNQIAGKRTQADAAIPIVVIINPWINQFFIEYGLDEAMKDELIMLKEKTGFEFERKYIFGGMKTVSGFLNQKKPRIAFFALESLSLPSARPLVENSILLGAIRIPVAYQLFGSKCKGGVVMYEEGTIFSKNLVEKKAQKMGISELTPTKTNDYWKIVNNEFEALKLCHTGAPMGAVIRAQNDKVAHLTSVPIDLGILGDRRMLFDKTELNSVLVFIDLIKKTLELLKDPRFYAKAIFAYLHLASRFEPSFRRIEMIDRIMKCRPTSHTEYDLVS